MEDELRPRRAHRGLQGAEIAHVTLDVMHHLRHARLFEQARLGGGWQRETGHLGAQIGEPERQPTALEAGMAGYEDAPSGPR